jgi:hypothetical protein
MIRPQFFSHRPPTSGIHLLSDPFPARLNGSISLFERGESLSAQREHIAAAARTTRVVTALKK